ncbi:hypothetical protein CROQUDRAFT_657288 [Cronartium quercuum f. sp. fusiforme G11]|uniref:Uncharacterized protein n=1 Tax=Cronartium quercuum f. sp. fusiforme G11 TaxID=708437 RepID=A0A9P6TC85_9BASI|nr:hypothetical protein CROQUDRAFT_657288 [Cronartium quercuum f. sp. fusiforme G11]
MIEGSKAPSGQIITHLFWPRAITPGYSGYLIGWRVGTAACVATLATSQWLESGQLEHVRVDLLSKQKICVELLGYLSDLESSTVSDRRIPSSKTWVELVFTEAKLTPRCPNQNEMLIVMYDRPSMKRHHFLSLQPLLKSSCISANSPKKVQRSNLPEKMRRLDEAYRNPSISKPKPNLTLPHVLCFINHSQELHERVLDKYSPPVTYSPQTDLEPSRPWRIPENFPSFLMLSTTVQQLNVRISEITSWPARYRKIWKGEEITLLDRRAEYVRLFNTLWLIANDVIFGTSSARFLMENAIPLAVWLESNLEEYTVTFFKKALQWTNSYPVGFKLNDELCEAFYKSSILAVDLWHTYVLKPTFGVLPHIIFITGLASFFGNTFALAIASDFFALSTFHLWLIYRIFTFIFDWHLQTLQVLFNIFRGRKFNVLRSRTEPAIYQLDQLILGTLMFTVATFLFPTVLAFYLLLGVTRLFIVAIHAIIDTSLSLLNHFPLFTVMLRLKDPARLPAGIRFVQLQQGPQYFKLENVPVGMTWIFADYIALWAELTSHYSPLQLLSRLFSGRPIAPLAGPRYYR